MRDNGGLDKGIAAKVIRSGQSEYILSLDFRGFGEM